MPATVTEDGVFADPFGAVDELLDEGEAAPDPPGLDVCPLAEFAAFEAELDALTFEEVDEPAAVFDPFCVLVLLDEFVPEFVAGAAPPLDWPEPCWDAWPDGAAAA